MCSYIVFKQQIQTNQEFNFFINNILLMQLGKIKKDYHKAFSQEEICTKEYKQDDNDDNDEGVAMWLV